MKAPDKIYLNRRHPEPYWFKDKQLDSDVEYIRKDALRFLKSHWKPSEEQDYSDLSDLERAIHRGFLCAGVENVPVAIIKETAKECLELANKERLRDDILTKMHLDGYTMGREDAMRDMMDFLKSRFNSEEAKVPNPPAINIPTWTPPCYNGGPCTNPLKDCINCPRANVVISPNTASGTSPATLHGNTSATDGKEHNPSFTD